MISKHKTVLMNETLNALDLKSGQKVFEGTGGGGGLSAMIASKVGEAGEMIVTDLDRDALTRVKLLIGDFKGSLHLVHNNFRNIRNIVTDLKIAALDIVTLDLGLSSDQLETSNRGFSFERNEDLIMTFNSEPSENKLTAKEIVNNWSEESLADIIWGFGGERNARKIARAIVEARKIKSVETTGELVQIIESVSKRSGKIHPATKTFQAIRIAVNDEIGALKQVLTDGWDMLAISGRFAVISFHEAEDRIVKNFFVMKFRLGEAELINKKAILPTREEVKNNPRSRSAKLRVAKKLM